MAQKEQMWPKCSPALTRSGSSHLNGSVQHEIKIHRRGNQQRKFKSSSSSLVSSCSALTQLDPRWLLQSCSCVEMLQSRGAADLGIQMSLNSCSVPRQVWETRRACHAEAAGGHHHPDRALRALSITTPTVLYTRGPPPP